ncbi:VOC family protein [Streptomyces sp. TP-A0874]|uniref:VOC family protein n=1 Tax=Streptomyces sp. TP-A0874 TaxID=549819 RepID=UPI000853EF5C|nr:VOC family protein [Streptomyces sp. TP-A0874]
MTEVAPRRTPGTPCWVSLMTHRLASSEEFYNGLFGWTFSPGPYVSALLDGCEVAGMGEFPDERRLPAAWTTYLATDDADVTAEQVRACGGTVAVGPLDVGEAGRVAIAADPLGAVFGVWQEGRRGTRSGGGPGTPVWNSLTTLETTGVGKFYAVVFGLEAVASGPEQLTLRVDGRAVAEVNGVGGELPPDRGPHWMTHFEVADVAATLRRATELGGRVVEQPREAPAGISATVADREGAVFTVLQPAD